MSEIALSIIIPVYNTGKYISRCLDSILNQPFDAPIEIICIDDGSTDDSAKICDEYASKNKKIRIIHKNNEGVASARNRGLDIARGNYIAWVDSDDYIAKNWYDVISPYMKKGYDMIMPDMYLVKGGKLHEVMYGSDSKKMSVEELCSELTLENISSHLVLKICKRTYWEKLRFPTNISYLEDYSIMHKLVINMSSIVYIHKPIYYYVQRGNSIVHTESGASEYQIKLAQERIRYFVERNINVSKIGEDVAIINFIWRFYKNEKNNTRLSTMDKYLKKLKRDFFNIIVANIRIEIKIKLILIIFRLVKVYAKHTE